MSALPNCSSALCLCLLFPSRAQELGTLKNVEGGQINLSIISLREMQDLRLNFSKVEGPTALSALYVRGLVTHKITSMLTAVVLNIETLWLK